MSIGMVPIEIKIGSMVEGVLPVYIKGGQAFIDGFRSEVIDIKIINFPYPIHIYRVDLTDHNRGKVWVPEYRIRAFMFGGIEIDHSKFDPHIIEDEDKKILKKRP